jgi:hypothetical protein
MLVRAVPELRGCEAMSSRLASINSALLPGIGIDAALR